MSDMKKGKILNRALNNAIAVMGHTDVLIVGDVGYPMPLEGAILVDLAITNDLPDLMTVIELLASDFIYERVIVAEEQKLYNPPLHKRLGDFLDRCPIETTPHTEIMGTWREKAKVIVRTGALEPWGNVVLVSGIDAPAYFAKKGVIVPDYYQNRASYNG
jgi:D-ribose pyranase